MRSWKLILVLLVLAGGAFGVTAMKGDETNHEVQHESVGSGPVTMTIETLGTVEPLATITVGCETTGKIVEILADHDQPVKKDAVICRIDPELVNAQHQQSVAELSRAKSAVAEAKLLRDEQNANLPALTAQALGRLNEAKAALIQADYNWKRIDELYRNGDAPEAEWKAANAAFERAKAMVEIASAAHDLAKNNEKHSPIRLERSVEQAQAAQNLAQAMFNTTQAQVDRCIIRSPIDGIVLKRFLDVGATVNATFQTPPLFLIAPSLQRMRVNAKVSESDIAHIDIGQRASFKVEGKRTTRFDGKILQKRFQPDIIQGVTTYTVILEVDNDARRTLLPGMSVNVVIECVHKPDARRLSNVALRFKPPITNEERRKLQEEAAENAPPAPTNADGSLVNYCKEDFAWKYNDQSQSWAAVKLWVGVTDNVHTEILAGADSGAAFVKKFIDKSKSGFSFKDALNLASPENRSL